MKLFTYSIPHDKGFAPNPYHGICTLNTCKPQIRREASEKDWVVGLKQDSVVYAMEVTEKISMEEYWYRCKKQIPKKIPVYNYPGCSYQDLCGDCQYDFSSTPPIQLPGFHKTNEYIKDLSGKYTLLSTNFIYFGENAIKLPSYLTEIAKYSNGKWIGVARKSLANNAFISDFVKWFNFQKRNTQSLRGKPADI
jgi:hypothetical protein